MRLLRAALGSTGARPACPCLSNRSEGQRGLQFQGQRDVSSQGLGLELTHEIPSAVFFGGIFAFSSPIMSLAVSVPRTIEWYRELLFWTERSFQNDVREEDIPE
jgi:hypothetical protein